MQLLDNLNQAGLANFGYAISEDRGHDFQVRLEPFHTRTGRVSRKRERTVLTSRSRDIKDDSTLLPRGCGVPSLLVHRVRHAATGADAARIVQLVKPDGRVWGGAHQFTSIVHPDAENVHPWHRRHHQCGGPANYPGRRGVKSASFFISAMDSFMESWGKFHGRPDIVQEMERRTGMRLAGEAKHGKSHVYTGTDITA